MFWQLSLFVIAAASVSSSDGCTKVCQCQNELEAISSRLVTREKAEESLVADLSQNLRNISRAVGDLSQGVAEVRQLKVSLEQLNERVEGVARHLTGLLAAEENCTEEDDAQPEESPKQCPDGWVAHAGSCYYFQLTKVRLTFETAKTQCDTKYPGSSLVAIESRDEFNFLKGYLNQRYESFRSSTTNGFFTSGKKVNGAWQWTNTGAGIDFNQLTWGSGEPNGQICLSLWPSYRFELADTDCGNYDRQFICEI